MWCVQVFQLEKASIGRVIGKGGSHIDDLRCIALSGTIELDTDRCLLLAIGSPQEMQKMLKIDGVKGKDLDGWVMFHSSAKTTGNTTFQEIRRRIEQPVKQTQCTFTCYDLQLMRDGSYPVRFSVVGPISEVRTVQSHYSHSLFQWHHYSLTVFGLSKAERDDLFSSVQLTRAVTGCESYIQLNNEEMCRLPEVFQKVQQLANDRK
eukprot:TRINITY_DN103389_c0_g1_i1.p1 TRINITY_DN103389_c0_g1~~TRINITY_DN103389_c0_g1_i1.p1  ORF type:complete len:206 (+),score=13.16 TRINITY_DN103389_c0_g1_i1:47-664(+)